MRDLSLARLIDSANATAATGIITAVSAPVCGVEAGAEAAGAGVLVAAAGGFVWVCCELLLVELEDEYDFC